MHTIFLSYCETSSRDILVDDRLLMKNQPLVKIVIADESNKSKQICHNHIAKGNV